METRLDHYANTCVVEDATAIRLLTSECTWCDETRSANARIVMDESPMLTLGQGTTQNPRRNFEDGFDLPLTLALL